MALNLGKELTLIHSNNRNRNEITIFENKSSEIIVALDGTGDTDDIQEALNMVTDGGAILIKEGTYNISSSLLFKSNGVELKGIGLNTRIQTTSNITMIDGQGYSHLIIKDLSLTGNNGSSSQKGIYIPRNEKGQVKNIVIDNITITSMGGDGIIFKVESGVSADPAFTQSRITNNYLDVEGTACHLDMSETDRTTTSMTQIIITGNFFQGTGAGSDGIHLNAAEDTGYFIEDCVIVGNICNGTGDAIHIDGSLNQYCVISNNVYNATIQDDTSGTDMTITDNQIGSGF